MIPVLFLLQILLEMMRTLFMLFAKIINAYLTKLRKRDWL